MSFRYLKTSQPIPGQGMSHTLYEVEGEEQINRMLTYIPDTAKIALYPNPPVKKLFAPERCEESSQEEFHRIWEEGSN